MNLVVRLVFLICAFLSLTGSRAADPSAAQSPSGKSVYTITPNDILEMRVFQEEDMTTKVRVARDGTATFPLIGVVRIGGKSVEEATALIRDLLDKDYLVNPQVTLAVLEYSKRRFTVLGQVQRPGSYEIPGEESVTLLQAIGMAGGYTRLANPSKIIIARGAGNSKQMFQLDGQASTKDDKSKRFEVLPDDTITVAERIF